VAEVSYETLFPEVMLHAQAVPEPVAVNAIRNACVEFCQNTLYMVQTFDAFSVLAREAVYELDTPVGYIVAKIIDPIYVDGMVVPAMIPNQLHTYYGMDWQQLTGSPTAFVAFTPGVITLVPTPELSGAQITGQYALQPTRASTTFDSEVLERYRETLVAGALSRILMTPGEAYYDPQKAMMAATSFRSGMASIRISASKANVGATTTVRMRRF
jgi:hypothetical protein